MTPCLPTLGFKTEKWTGSTHCCQVFHFTLVSPILKFLCLRQSHVKFPSALIVVIPELPLWVILKIALQKSRTLITIKWWLALRAELHRSQDSHSISMNWPVTIISPNTHNQNVISKTKQRRSNYLTASNKIHFFCFGYIMRGIQADMSLLPGLSKLLQPTSTSFWILSKKYPLFKFINNSISKQITGWHLNPAVDPSKVKFIAFYSTVSYAGEGNGWAWCWNPKHKFAIELISQFVTDNESI